MPITPKILDNPKSDRVRRITDLARAKGRERSGRFLIEGPQSVREAVTWRPDVVQDLYVEVAQALDHPRIVSSTLERIVEASQDATIYVHQCTGDVIRRISADAQGILAVGNAQAMQSGVDDLDAADAAGCDAVIFVDDCVDVLNPKVIRSTAGSLFHLPVLTMRTDEFFDWTSDHHVDVWAADVYGTEKRKPESLPAVLADKAAVSMSQAVLFGNEARGLEPEILERCGRIVSIPLYGKAESLNLGTSAAVMLMSLSMSGHVERM